MESKVHRMYNCEISAEYDEVEFDDEGNIVEVIGHDEHHVTRSRWRSILFAKAWMLYWKLVIKLPRRSIYRIRINRCDYEDV